MHRSVSANIYYLYLIKLSKWLMLIMPVVALFYAENGLDALDIYLLQAVYSLSVAVLEIPSGYLADTIGRRTSLIIGSLLGTLGFVVLAFSHSLTGFLAAEIILGLGGSCISGSDSALLFDSLAEKKQENYYLRYEGRITALGNLAETLAAIVGGLLAAWLSYRSVYGAQALVASIAIPAALLIIEPRREKSQDRPSLGKIYEITRHSLFCNKQLGSTIFISSVAGTATLCMAWTSQVYFVTVGFSELQITPLWVLLNLTVAILSACADKVVRFMGEKTALFLLSIYLPLGYILLGTLPLYSALTGLFFFYVVRGYATPMLRDLINQNCSSSIRATVLSIRSLLVRLGFSIAGPAIGVGADLYSLQAALVIFGIILLFVGIPAAFIVSSQLHLQRDKIYKS